MGDYRSRAKYAMKLWTELVYAKEPSGVCPGCRKRQWHDAAHGWTRGAYPSMRLELQNGIPLCRACHRRVDSDHQAKRDLWTRYYGVGVYCTLELRAIGRSKVDIGLTILYLERETETIRKALEAKGYTWPIRPSRGAS
jgi:hypothetical protein